MITERQDYVELESVEEAYARLDEWNIWQIKYDGIWARVVIDDGQVTIFSRTGQQKDQFMLPQRELFYAGRTELIAEYMFGSQWAQKEGRKGKIYVFDCTMLDGANFSELPYKERYRQVMAIVEMLKGPFELVKSLGKPHLGGFWLTSKEEYEGVILRKWDDPYKCRLLKLKYEVEDDFIITGFKPGNGKYEGMVGAFVVSQYDENNQLVEVMSVSGMDDYVRGIATSNPDAYLNKVCLVTGKSRFESGALRHPAYQCLRSDKSPTECRLKRTSQ